MNDIELEDTIVAISTPLQRSAIGIVRLSGKDALRIVEKIFLGKIKPYKISWGKIKIDNIEDEAIVLYFKGPKSYTGEDVVEIQTHGNPILLEKILEKAAKLGAREAKRGEFTLRAFLNGKKDLLEAEAVNSIINSITSEQLKINTSLLTGKLSVLVKGIRKELIRVISDIEAALEFPDYEIEIDWEREKLRLKKLIEKVEEVLKTGRYGEKINNGVNLLILGKPNVGKSTYINALLGEERVIVSEIEGTTRDVIRETIDHEGIPFHIFDTAGIRSVKEDKIERYGIEKALKLKDEADFIVLIFDAEKGIDSSDFFILNEIKGRNTIFVLNKIDKVERKRLEAIKKQLKINDIIEMSAKRGINIKEPLKRIEKRIKEGLEESNVLIVQRRQRREFLSIKESLESALKNIGSFSGEEFVLEDLRRAKVSCGKLLGEIYDEEILHEIFDNFCVGK